MIEWRRVQFAKLCGGCGKPIYQDQPAKFFKLQNMKRELVRCVECDGPAPPGLPPAGPRRTTKAMQPLMLTGRKVISGMRHGKLPESDWTARILGERER